jgi:hypothetical protein
MSEAELARRILALERRVAIKLCHERTGTDLGGAKAAVDRIEAQYLSGG